MCQDCIKQLGVDSRLKIYNIIKKENRVSVGDVVKNINLTQPTVSYHLKQLEGAGLIKGTKQSRKVYYQINKSCHKGKGTCIFAEADLRAEN
jgi:ArsR family transcriptional regulator, arsenate/arsenite/antimonite-responsive transcriptional repressor